MIKITLLIFLVLTFTSTSIVSKENLEIFFNSTYDTNHDGKASLEEFVAYFRLMEPEFDINEDDVSETFEIFDSNNDKSVTLSELLQISQIKIGKMIGHKQIHLSFTNQENEMQVMWVTNPVKYHKPVVYYGTYPTKMNKKVYAISKTYDKGHIGFHGLIYKAIMIDLEPNKRYYYKVGDDDSYTFSEIKYFKSPPKKNVTLPEINIAVFGDMGTFAPFGSMVMNQISRNNFKKPYDFVFLTGDIAYAGVSSESKGEIEPIWDLFGELSESFAAYTSFMTGVGNHEKYYDYAAYTARYELPRSYPGQPNLWFSFEYGQVHIAYFSSEHPYNKGSQQYAFLENDLRNARQNPNIKWIIVGTHRPFYSSNEREFSNQTNLAKELEELMNTYKVDIVQNGHIHSYQRSWPLFGGKADKEGHTESVFKNPKHPIYVVQATAGAYLYKKWVNPAPQYAIKRILKYGYGRINIQGNTLKYQFIEAPLGKIVDEWIIVKD